MSPTLKVMEQGDKNFLEGLHAATREMMKCYEVKIVDCSLLQYWSTKILLSLIISMDMPYL